MTVENKSSWSTTLLSSAFSSFRAVSQNRAFLASTLKSVWSDFGIPCLFIESAKDSSCSSLTDCTDLALAYSTRVSVSEVGASDCACLRPERRCRCASWKRSSSGCRCSFANWSSRKASHSPSALKSTWIFYNTAISSSVCDFSSDLGSSFPVPVAFNSTAKDPACSLCCTCTNEWLLNSHMTLPGQGKLLCFIFLQLLKKCKDL